MKTIHLESADDQIIFLHMQVHSLQNVVTLKINTDLFCFFVFFIEIEVIRLLPKVYPEPLAYRTHSCLFDVLD